MIGYAWLFVISAAKKIVELSITAVKEQNGKETGKVNEIDPKLPFESLREWRVFSESGEGHRSENDHV